jgi:predicted P-loop ATPase
MNAPNWLTILDCSDKGPRPNLTNAVRVLQHDPTLGPDLLWRDEFLDQVIIRNSEPRAWRDDDDTRLTVYMQDHTGLANIQERTVAAAVRLVARQRVKHVVRDWMQGLCWDGVPRVARAFTDYWGAALDEYTCCASYNFFVGMVARVLLPGCKLDTMPVFEGPQGIKKSTALQVLGGPWYSIAHESVGSKDFLQGLRGVWLLEIAELQSFSKADVMSVKNMLSAPHDDYRPSYGRAVVRFPRQCVMAGTTNADDWGTDDTGLRRFWPIRCGAIDLDALRQDRDHLVAEAVALFAAKARWWDMPAAETLAIQRDRQHFDEWTRPVLDWCRLQPTAVDGGESVSLKDILAGPLQIPIDRANKADQMRVARILKLAGWVRKKIRLGEETAWVWENVPASSGNTTRGGNEKP